MSMVYSALLQYWGVLFFVLYIQIYFRSSQLGIIYVRWWGAATFQLRTELNWVSEEKKCWIPHCLQGGSEYLLKYYDLLLQNVLQLRGIQLGPQTNKKYYYNIYNYSYYWCFQQFYPVNYLRNIALENVRTPYVFLSDVDFVPVPGMYGSLK